MEKQYKLLISDDSAEWNRDVSRAFQEAGMEPIFVKKDGFQVMERIKRDIPDFVLIDLFMPGLDAIGVINATRRSVEKVPLFFVKCLRRTFFSLRYHIIFTIICYNNQNRITVMAHSRREEGHCRKKRRNRHGKNTHCGR